MGPRCRERIMAVLKILGRQEGRWESYFAGVTGIKKRYPRLTGLHQRMEAAYLSRENEKPMQDLEVPKEEFDEGVFIL